MDKCLKIDLVRLPLASRGNKDQKCVFGFDIDGVLINTPKLVAERLNKDARPMPGARMFTKELTEKETGFKGDNF